MLTLIYIATRFMAKVGAPDFDSAQALEMLQTHYTLNYGSSRAGSRPANIDDEYYPIFHFDFISIVGRPLKPIVRRSTRFFDNVTITFRRWHAPYSAKHLHGTSFELAHRTFRLATGAAREAWYIVLHPVAVPVEEPPPSRQDRRKRREASSQSSAVQYHHAQALASYIKQVFGGGELLGEGIEPSWVLGGQDSQTITFNKWAIFQREFMDGWPEFVEQHKQDQFWTDNQPAFHAYDYGANIEIEVSERLQALPKEHLLRPSDDSEDSENGEDNEDNEDSEEGEENEDNEGGEDREDGGEEGDDSPNTSGATEDAYQPL